MSNMHKDTAHRTTLMLMVWLITKHKMFNNIYVYRFIYMLYIFYKNVSYLVWYHNYKKKGDLSS
jgi:hypothetical protein